MKLKIYLSILVGDGMVLCLVAVPTSESERTTLDPSDPDRPSPTALIANTLV
jgi:hypothetical protein